MSFDQLKKIAPDFRNEGSFPRSPREELGGFVIAARMLDKARAFILEQNGEYNFYPCGLGGYFWKFTGLDHEKFKDFVATGATDEEVDKWIIENASVKDKMEKIKWNFEMAGMLLKDLSPGSQEYLSEYIVQYCKPASKVKFFFDVYDVEEGRL